MKDLTLPKVMMVSDEPITEDNPGFKRVVWAHNDKFNYQYFCYSPNIQTIDQANAIPIGGGAWLLAARGWWSEAYKYAQDVKIIELTLEDIANKFGVNVSLIKIKK